MKEKKTKIKSDLCRVIREGKFGRRNAGITLVALVITIIILLILAGVSINFIFGNEGIFTKAQTAVDRYQNAQTQEETQIAKFSNEIDSYVGNSRNIVEYKLIWYGTADSTGDYYLDVKNEETGEKYSWTDFKFALIVGHDPKGGEDKTMLIPTFLTSNEVGSCWTVDGSNGADGGVREICFSLGQNKFTVVYAHTEQIKYIYGIN